MEKFKFDCGCEFDIIGPAKHKFTIPRLKIDLYNLREDCPKTWELVKSGKTQGVFQVESQLGQTWSKKVSPDNIDELGAIGALVRPGCLKSISEGKSLTEHYADRRNGREAVKSFHPVVDECLKNTYNVMVYQEDAIRLASTIAGFTLEEADQLRKAIGKKIASEMSKLKTLFLEKALALGIVSKEQAEEVFDWIEKSQRYSFNKCITEDTIVETESGLKTIDELKIGEKIKAPNSLDSDEFVTVINKFDQGEQEVFEIILESGKSIKCTMNHKFLASNGLVKTLAEIIEENLNIFVEAE